MSQQDDTLKPQSGLFLKNTDYVHPERAWNKRAAGRKQSHVNIITFIKLQCNTTQTHDNYRPKNTMVARIQGDSVFALLNETWQTQQTYLNICSDQMLWLALAVGSFSKAVVKHFLSSRLTSVSVFGPTSSYRRLELFCMCYIWSLRGWMLSALVTSRL